MLDDVVLHDFVMPMGVYANVYVMRETEIHDAAEYAVNIRIAGNPMDYMVRLAVIKPFPVIYMIVGRLWRWQESKVANHPSRILHHKGPVSLHVSSDGSLGRVVPLPLVHVPGLPHNLLGGLYNLHNISHVRRYGFSDYPLHALSCSKQLQKYSFFNKKMSKKHIFM